MSRRRDWFAEGFGNAMGDVRNKIIEEGWFGRHPGEVKPGKSMGDGGEEIDLVLAAKLIPDKIADKLFLHALELDDLRSGSRSPDRGADWEKTLGAEHFRRGVTLDDLRSARSDPDRDRSLDIDIDR